ncbi:MAG: PadR family transcriptional regulator [Chloroflexi bacterium]|nr:PadR family transcriptional regulator [Chloroflexota bacterium]MBU1747346.1 PadR family transcriptional regulator [Chloroflexota bacterium]
MSVRNAILGLLAQRPRHGYELRAAFEAVAGGEQNWSVKPAQIYTTLARLEEANLVSVAAVEQDGGPQKRVYDITPAGRAELDVWFASRVDREHQRDELFLKLMLALITGAANPYQVIQNQRTALYQDLHDLVAQRNQADPKTELAQILLLEQAVMHLEADLRWLDMVEVRLDEVRRQPMPEPEVKTRGRPKKIAH